MRSTAPKSRQLSFVSSGLHSYSVVEKTDISEMLRGSIPEYSVPSRTTFFRSVVLDVGIARNTAVRSDLPSISDTEVECYNITTDSWTRICFVFSVCIYVSIYLFISMFCLCLASLLFYCFNSFIFTISPRSSAFVTWQAPREVGQPLIQGFLAHLSHQYDNEQRICQRYGSGTFHGIDWKFVQQMYHLTCSQIIEDCVARIFGSSSRTW